MKLWIGHLDILRDLRFKILSEDYFVKKLFLIDEDFREILPVFSNVNKVEL